MKIGLYVNDRFLEWEVRADEYLLESLRTHHFTSVKKGCDTTACGVCTVLQEGEPIASCGLLTFMAEGKHITTVEGIRDEAEKLAHFFGEEGADQCGFCNPGLALAVYALKMESQKKQQQPSLDEIKTYLIGNLCRCSGYVAQHKAILKYLEVQL